jgi:hypothetical protein
MRGKRIRLETGAVMVSTSNWRPVVILNGRAFGDLLGGCQTFAEAMEKANAMADLLAKSLVSQLKANHFFKGERV